MKVTAKCGQNAERRRQREENFARAMAAHNRGDESGARAFFARSVHVTHEMAHQLIDALREKDIPFLVAP